MKARQALFAKQLTWLQDTNWWQMLGYAWLVFVFAASPCLPCPRRSSPCWTSRY